MMSLENDKTILSKTFASEFRPNECQFRQRAIQFCKKREPIVHERNSFPPSCLFHFYHVFFLAKFSSIMSKFFNESEIEIRSRDLDFHLARVQFQSGQIGMEKL